MEALVQSACSGYYWMTVGATTAEWLWYTQPWVDTSEGYNTVIIITLIESLPSFCTR